MKKFMFFLIIPYFFYNTLFAQQWTGTSTPSSTISRTGEVGIGLSSATWSGATSSSTRQMLTVDAGTTGYAASKAGIFLNRSNRSTGVLSTGVYLGELNAYSAHSWGTAVLAQMDITSTYNPSSTSVARLGGGSFTCNLANNINGTNGTTEIYGLYANLTSSNPSAITTFPTNGYMAALVANDAINKSGTLAILSTGKIRFQGLATQNTNTKILTGDATGNLAWRDLSTIGGTTYTGTGGISVSGNTISAQNFAPLWNANQLQGKSISAIAPTNGQILKWDGVNWTPSADNNTAYTAGTGITITNNVISSNLVSSQWSPSSPSTNVTANSNIITYDGRIAVGELCTSAGFNKYPTNYSGYFGNAGILASGLRIANICDPFNWADFVFEKDYHLPSLSSEKEYIEKNGHLRDVPSAKEIAEKGIDVAEMFKVQMQKIEELTLHTIALSEKVEKLQAENEALKVKLAK